MGTLPLIDRPTPVMDILKERPTLVLDQPLITLVDGKLPARGTGIIRGTAGERRAGSPRSFLERVKRHQILGK